MVVAFQLKGEQVTYISYDGLKSCKIVSGAVFQKRTYYLLENGDYVAETPFGLVKTAVNHC